MSLKSYVNYVGIVVWKIGNFNAKAKLGFNIQPGFILMITDTDALNFNSLQQVKSTVLLWTSSSNNILINFKLKVLWLVDLLFMKESGSLDQQHLIFILLETTSWQDKHKTLSGLLYKWPESDVNPVKASHCQY